MDEETIVSYSLKEVLTDINHKLDAALSVIHTKADKVAVVELEVRLRKIEGHIERTEQNKTASEHRREWIIPAVITAVLALFTILQAFHI